MPPSPPSSSQSRLRLVASIALTMVLLELTRRLVLGLACFVALTPGEDVFNLKGGWIGGGVSSGTGIASVKAQSGGVAAGEYLLGLGIGDVTG
ncbi:hypothetical protein ACEPAF_5399 [Sanghuangporus sanghuang]